MDERAQILQLAVDQVKGRIPILVGVGSNNAVDTLAMTHQALDLGCDAALLVTPYYIKPPPRCLIQHAVSVAKVGLPVILYNVPSRTGVDFQNEHVATAASLHENIVGLKDATGQLDRVADLRRRLSDRFLLYSGDDATSADFVLQGGDGCISVTANVAPAAVQQVMVAALRQDGDLARRIDEPLQALHRDLFCESNPIPVKYACFAMGLIKSPYCRPPLDSLDPAKEASVMQAMRAAAIQVQS
jgi:4-hydroxy-tetrahydrodipicolinate synthase